MANWQYENNWHFETGYIWESYLRIFPDVRITFKGFRPYWSFDNSQQAGRMHGMSDYGEAILHKWEGFGWAMTMEKIYETDKSRIIVDDYGTMSHAK